MMDPCVCLLGAGWGTLVNRKEIVCSAGSLSWNINLHWLFSLVSEEFITKMTYNNEKAESFMFIFLPQRYFVNSF